MKLKNFEGNKSVTTPQKLEDILAFLILSKDEQEYINQTREAASLASSGRMDLAVEKIKKINQKQPEKKKFTEVEEKIFAEARGKIAEQLGYKVVENGIGKWFSLEKNGYHIQMKHFIIPSGFGISGGRIGAIDITSIVDQREAARWESGGWITEPENQVAKKIFEELVSSLN